MKYITAIAGIMDGLDKFLDRANWQTAWEHVAKNHGAAGVDGETIEHFARDAENYLTQLRKAIATGNYRPLPLRQVFIPKRDKTWRSIGIPTVRDRIAQQALLNILHPLLEPEFEECSFAYRPGRSHQMAVRQVSKWRDRGYEWVLDADLVSYFDNIRHDRLLAEVRDKLDLPAYLELIERWLTAGLLTKEGLILPSKGVAQGAVVSPILANLYLDSFDEAMIATGLKLVRYADDFVLLAKQEKQLQATYQIVIEILSELGLQLHPEKTEITNFDRGFRFLGQTFIRSMVVPDRPKSDRQHKRDRDEFDRVNAERASPLIIYPDPQPPPKPTAMERALLESLETTNRPIPPPLFVLFGYRVREPERVTIESQELEWKTGMSTLYLVEQGATLRKEQSRFIVKSAGKETTGDLTEIPIEEVDRVLVFGNIQLSTSAIGVCLEAQIPVIFLSQLGEYKGHLWSSEQTNLLLESQQFRQQDDLDFKLKMARKIVAGKILNSRHLLLRLNRKRSLVEVDRAVESIGQAEEIYQKLAAMTTLEQIRGYEGAAAASYFGALGQLITNSGFSLTTRNRRPPKDPVNALLSFGYTLLFNNVLSLILAEGLNPYLGNLHGSDRASAFLAFDLMEEFRSPIVDTLVMRLINQKILRPTDFTFPDRDGGIYLEATPRRLFLKHFETRISTPIKYLDLAEPISYRRVIELQVRQYTRVLLDGVDYVPFRRVD
ncbi:group II intron reverse transcriptase/maturase [Chamaesiphon sp.]|uniref:group II intron reverse transcriptase/maturase n=1 Tax=Chamaesiphon sp. TaxID=2814140 RepID=UPI0035942454